MNAALGLTVALIFVHGPSLAQTGNQADAQDIEVRATAWFDCLERAILQSANGRKPTQADGEAAQTMCSSHKDVFLKAHSAEGEDEQEAEEGSYGGMTAEWWTDCFEDHFVEEIFFKYDAIWRHKIPGC